MHVPLGDPDEPLLNAALKVVQYGSVSEARKHVALSKAFWRSKKSGRPFKSVLAVEEVRSRGSPM